MADISSAQRVSSFNSSTTPLGISGVFTGTAEDVSEFATVSIAIFSDVASVVNGLSIQFSVDGTNWDHTDGYTIMAATGKTFTIGRVARYFRIVYTNGTTAQNTFRLQTILNDTLPKPSSHRIQDNLTTEEDAELVKSIISGENQALPGQFTNILAANGRLLVETSEAEASNHLIEGKVFYATVSSYTLISAGSNNPIFLVKNPSGSGKTMFLFSVVANCRVTNVQVTFLLFKNPTILTNGTSFTPANANFSHTNTSSLEVYTGSTVVSTGTLIVGDQVGQNSNSSNMILSERIAIAPGQTLLLTGDPFSNNRAIIMSIGWVEN